MARERKQVLSKQQVEELVYQNREGLALEFEGKLSELRARLLGAIEAKLAQAIEAQRPAARPAVPRAAKVPTLADFPALAVACPKCGAEPGKVCTSEKGPYSPSASHAARKA